MEFAGADDIDGKPEGVSEWESANGASGKPCDIDVPKHRRSPRTGEVESINFGGDDVGARGQAATTSLLNDFAGNGSVLIKQIDGAHSVIAICDDEFQMAWISDEQQRRKLLAGRDCDMIFSYVRIG